jgi:hypothetical protein
LSVCLASEVEVLVLDAEVAILGSGSGFVGLSVVVLLDQLFQLKRKF